MGCEALCSSGVIIFVVYLIPGDSKPLSSITDNFVSPYFQMPGTFLSCTSLKMNQFLTQLKNLFVTKPAKKSGTNEYLSKIYHYVLNLGYINVV